MEEKVSNLNELVAKLKTIKKCNICGTYAYTVRYGTFILKNGTYQKLLCKKCNHIYKGDLISKPPIEKNNDDKDIFDSILDILKQIYTSDKKLSDNEKSFFEGLLKENGATRENIR